MRTYDCCHVLVKGSDKYCPDLRCRQRGRSPGTLHEPNSRGRGCSMRPHIVAIGCVAVLGSLFVWPHAASAWDCSLPENKDLEECQTTTTTTQPVTTTTAENTTTTAPTSTTVPEVTTVPEETTTPHGTSPESSTTAPTTTVPASSPPSTAPPSGLSPVGPPGRSLPFTGFSDGPWPGLIGALSIVAGAGLAALRRRHAR